MSLCTGTHPHAWVFIIIILISAYNIQSWVFILSSYPHGYLLSDWYRRLYCHLHSLARQISMTSMKDNFSDLNLWQKFLPFLHGAIFCCHIIIVASKVSGGSATNQEGQVKGDTQLQLDTSGKSASTPQNIIWIGAGCLQTLQPDHSITWLWFRFWRYLVLVHGWWNILLETFNW